MKTSNIVKAFGAAGLATALTSAAVAGPYSSGSYSSGGSGKQAPIMTPPVVAPVDDSLGFSLSAGYDSSYIFRGVDFGENLVWVGLDYANDFGSPVEWHVGAWYAATNGSDGDEFDELDLYTGLGTSLGPVDLSLGFIWYYFPDDGSDTQELYTSLGYEFYGLGIEFYAGYDFEPEGWYLALSGGYSLELTDAISLDFSAGVSYIDEYFVDDSGFNNIDLRLALPIALTDSATLEPYVAGSIALDALEDNGEDDYLYGGVSIGVDF